MAIREFRTAEGGVLDNRHLARPTTACTPLNNSAAARSLVRAALI